MQYGRDTKGIEKHSLRITTLEFVLKRSAEVSPENIIVYNNLGCYYAAKENRDTAIERFNKALKMCRELGEEEMAARILENKRMVQDTL